MNVSFSDKKYIEFMSRVNELNITKPKITEDKNFTPNKSSGLNNDPYMNGGNYGGLLNRVELRPESIYLVFNLSKEENKIVEDAYSIFGDELVASVSVSIKHKNVFHAGITETGDQESIKFIILNDFYSLDYFSLVKKHSDLNIGNISSFVLNNELYIPLVTNGRVEDIKIVRLFTDIDIFRKYFSGERGKPLKDSISKGEVGVYFQFPRPRLRIK